MTLSAIPEFKKILDGFESQHCIVFDLSSTKNFHDPIHNYPQKWVNRYLDENYYNDDLIFKEQKMFSPFVWSKSDFSKVGGKARQLYQDANSFDIRSGVSIKFTQEDNTTKLLCLASSQNEKSYRNYFHKQDHHLVPTLMMLTIYLQLFQNQENINAQQELGHLILQLQQQNHCRQQLAEEAYAHIYAFTAEVNRSLTPSLTATSKKTLLPLCQMALKKLHRFCYKGTVW